MPFSCPRCVVDTNVMSDFYQCNCLELIWSLYPGGVWIDPYVSEELKTQFGLNVQLTLEALQLPYQFTSNYDEVQLLEMVEIKKRRRALKFADISCIVNAKINDAVCLSADKAVVKTCAERGVKVARHGGLLEESLKRDYITKPQALTFLSGFLSQGLTMPPSLRDELLNKFS